MYPFHLTYNLSPFFLHYFFDSKLILICFLKFFFIKSSNKFFSIKIFNSISPQHNIFNFFNHKNFFRPFWSLMFCKNIFIFQYSNNIANFKFRIFIINFFTTVNICVSFYINRFHFNCTILCIVVFINYIILLINIHVFWNWSNVFINFIFKGSIESFSNNRFSFIICYIHFYLIILQKWFHWSIVKFTTFIYPYFICFVVWSILKFLKSISDCNSFFIF